ncbi:hypothetical protein ACHAXR_000637, partial [Thalassiosira sp. AJA248-18]
MENMVEPTLAEPELPSSMVEVPVTVKAADGTSTTTIKKEPKDPEVLKMEIAIHMIKVKSWMEDLRAWLTNRARLYALVLMHCPPDLEEVLKTMSAWKDVRDGQDAIELLKMVRDVEMVEKWVTAVQTLAQIARRFPQTVYCGFTFCLQNEWQYVQRVVADTAPFFAPLERTIRNDLIPALLEIPRCEVTAGFRTLLSHSVKKGGLAIRNPVDTASYVHEASMSATSHLTDSLVDASVLFDFRTHRNRAEYFLQRARKQRLEREQDYLDERAEGAPAVERRDN